MENIKNTDKIKAKIKALLSKTTENGASQHEMEASLKKANELMLDYFISEHDLKDTDIIERCVLKEVPLIKSGYDLTMFYAELSRLFDCEHFYNSKRIAFFGFEQDTELCAYFYNFIIKSCLSEKEKYLKTNHYATLKARYHGRTLVSSFIKGFQLSVAAKMSAMYWERRRNIPQSYGLMVIQKEENVKSQFKERNVKISSAAKRKHYSESAVFAKGIEAGNRLNIIQGIDSNTSTLRLE